MLLRCTGSLLVCSFVGVCTEIRTSQVEEPPRIIHQSRRRLQGHVPFRGWVISPCTVSLPSLVLFSDDRDLALEDMRGEFLESCHDLLTVYAVGLMRTAHFDTFGDLRPVVCFLAFGLSGALLGLSILRPDEDKKFLHTEYCSSIAAISGGLAATRWLGGIEDSPHSIRFPSFGNWTAIPSFPSS